MLQRRWVSVKMKVSSLSTEASSPGSRAPVPCLTFPLWGVEPPGVPPPLMPRPGSRNESGGFCTQWHVCGSQQSVRFGKTVQWLYSQFIKPRFIRVVEKFAFFLWQCVCVCFKYMYACVLVHGYLNMTPGICGFLGAVSHLLWRLGAKCGSLERAVALA